MRRILLYSSLFIFFYLCFALKNTYASHSMGADLTYTCLGGNSYKLRLSFYRDCYGVAASSQATITISSVSCAQDFTVNLDPIPGTGQEITPICPSAVSTCNGGTYTGIEEWIYEGTVTLPAQCTDWDFSYDLCCRNAAITTVSAPDVEDIYIHSFLNNTITPCNNSPTFTNKPVPFVCLGQEFCFNHGAYDVDGDSLAYSLITPLGAGGVPITYLNPYIATQPLNSVPPMTFDPQSGDFCATPQSIQVTVMAVLVKEYRNGVLIGEVERDIQITVIPCNNTLPNLTGINGTNNFTATICADAPFCFDIFSNDPDAGQNVSLSWDTSIVAGTFNTSGVPYPTGTFCWTPSQADVSPNSHCFTVRVWDDACPYFGSQIYSYCLTVVNLTVDAGPDQSVACNNTVAITAVAGGTPGTYIYQWSNGSTNASQSVGAGTYTVTVSNGLCTATDEVTVATLTGPVTAFSSTGVCTGTLASFTDQTTIASGTITGWNWNFGDGNTSVQQNPVHQYATIGTYNVCFIVSSDVGCTDTVCQLVTVSNPPVAGFNTTNVCDGETIYITNTSTPVASINSYSWDLGNGSTSVLQNPSVLYTGTSTYNITLIVTDTLGCADTIQQPVTIYPLPLAAFTLNYNGCQSYQTTFTDNSTGTIAAWNWTFGDGQTSNLQNPIITYSSPGTYTITLVVTTTDGCIDSITQILNVIPPIVATPGLPQSICNGQQTIISASGGITYLWSDGQSGSPITINPTATSIYTVTITDANGCTDTTSVLVTIFPLPQLIPDPDAVLCNGQSVTINVSGATNYIWSTGETTAAITVTPAVTTSYLVTGTDTNGCSATVSVNVTINNPPVVTLPDLSFCSGASAQLDAGLSGMSYLWSDGQTIQNITVTQSGIYIVTVTDVNGCSDTAQSVVTVYPLPQIVISPDTALCNGESTTINISGAPNYIWNTGETTNTIIVAPSSTSIYTVSGTDANSCVANASVIITINNPPFATMQDIAFCTGATGLLDAGLTGMTYLWNGGQTIQSISVSQAGLYIVTVTDANGCSDTAQSTVTVFPLPQLNTCPDRIICDGETTSLNVSGAVSYIWSTGAITSTINVSPSTNTSYSVTGTDINGCESSATINVVVNNLPVVTLSDVSVCPGYSALLDAGVSGLTYQWSTGQTAQDISASQAGSYILTVTDQNGCSDTAQAIVTIFAQPQVSAGSDQDICKGESITLTATGGVAYIWNTGDPTADITVSPMNNANYSVVGTANNGCMDTAFVNVTVHKLPVLNIPNSLVCAGSTATLDAGHPGAIYIWSTGQTSQSIVVSQPGSYTVTITNVWGCSASQVVQVAPGGSISNNTNIVSFCMGDSAMLDAANPGNTYFWTPGGETTQTITVSSSGQYSVIVTNNNGCSGTVNTTVSVNPLPLPGFIANGGCAGQPVNFTDTTNASIVTINQWSWDFGDGTNSLLQNPVHSYSSSGAYIVTLTITSDSGCTASFSQSINTAALPVANFSSAGACVDIPVQFTDGSAGGNITVWHWNFGDGTTSVLQNPTHSYIVSGTYSVTLTAITSNGCSDAKTKQIVIHSLPNANFTSNIVCRGFNTLFTDLSSDSTGTINSWSWDFGDGNSSLQPNPSHLYLQSGNFITQLIITSSFACVDTISQNVIVNALPAGNAGPDQALCQGQPVTLIAYGGTAYLWSSGQTIATITVNPAATTSYIITVTNNNGCKNSDTVMVGVGSVPVVNLTDVFICTGNSAMLNAGNSGSSYIWSTGETTQGIAVSISGNYSVIVTNTAGCTGMAQAIVTVGGEGLTDNLNDASLCPGQPAIFNAGNSGSGFLWSTGATTQSITATATGIYIVTISDTSGCAASFSAALTINPIPVADFSSNVACLNSQTIFTNSSSVATGTIASNFWNFGDGTTSQLQNPAHTYISTGTFNVGLTVTSDMGCTDSITMPAHIYSVPVAAFTAPDKCLYSPVVFSDNSYVINDSISSWNWNFGDNSSSFNQNDSHYYGNAGNYQVLLIVTTLNGCIDSAMHNIVIHPVPDAGYSANSVCEDVPVLFIDTSTINSGTIVSWNWMFGDSTTGSLQNPSHHYPAYGIYAASLIVTSNYGCIDTAIHNISVFPLSSAVFTSTNVCLGNSTIFSNQSTVPSGTFSSGWDFGDGDSSSTQNPLHIYQSPGTFNSQLTLITNNGCTATISHPVVVYNLPVAHFTVNDICLGQPAVFTDQSVSASGTIISRLWNMGDGTIDTVLNPLHNYSNFGHYTVTLEVTTSFGCTDIYTDTITIFRLPEPIISASNSCITDPVTFTDISDTSLTGAVSWLWNFGDGSSSVIKNSIHLYQSPGTYTITLTSYTANGCAATTTMQLEIYPIPAAGFTNGNACAGYAVEFTNSSSISSGTISGYQWFFGDSASSIEINPSHIYIHAGTYSLMLIATSNYGCTDTAWGQVVIFENPVTDFVFDKAAGCGPLTINFTDSSYIIGSTIVSWNWNFGDSNFDTVQNPVHIYTTTGTYPVSLNTISADGCMGSFIIDNAIEIYPDPVAAFTPDPYVTTILQPVYFKNQSTGATVYQWNFGDGVYSDLENPQHLYNDTGRYVIYLIAINQYGCPDTAYNEVVMTPTYTVYVPNTFTPNDDGLNEIFTLYGIGIKNYELFIWNRWGDLIFDGINRGWNGKVRNRNESAKEDVYVYRVVFRDIFNDMHKLNGRVNLVK